MNCQPNLVEYILAAEIRLPRFVHNRLLTLLILILESFELAAPGCPTVTKNALQRAHTANERLAAPKDSEFEYDHLVEQWLTTYRQRPLLDFAFEAFDGHTDDPDLDEEDLGSVLLHLKTVIDCLEENPKLPKRRN